MAILRGNHFKTYHIKGIINENDKQVDKGYTVYGDISTVHDLKRAAIEKYKECVPIEKRCPLLRVHIVSMKNGTHTYYDRLLASKTQVSQSEDYYLFIPEVRDTTWYQNQIKKA